MKRHITLMIVFSSVALLAVEHGKNSGSSDKRHLSNAPTSYEVLQGFFRISPELAMALLSNPKNQTVISLPLFVDLEEKKQNQIDMQGSVREAAILEVLAGCKEEAWAEIVEELQMAVVGYESNPPPEKYLLPILTKMHQIASELAPAMKIQPGKEITELPSGQAAQWYFQMKAIRDQKNIVPDKESLFPLIE